MSWGPRVLLCCVLVGCAGDSRLDPSQLGLRDVLGISPEAALVWNPEQREAARKVLDAGLHAPQAPVHAALGREPTIDRSVTNALATADVARARQKLSAMGVVELALGRNELQATARPSTLTARAAAPIELQFAGWSDRPGLALLPARGVDVLTTIATDAGHHSGPIIVTPAPQLAVIAAYLPATAASPARLVVNPVLLASLDPKPGAAPPLVLAVDTIGNPYTFYTSISECANAQATRCEACLSSGNCTPIAGIPDCPTLAAGQGRGYSLECINLALAIDSVESCAAAKAPTCPVVANASGLEQNSDFLDKPDCAGELDVCLDGIYGNGPATTTPETNNSTSCSDSACDASPNCDDSGCDGSCDDTSGSEGADDGCDGGGGDCSSDDSGGDCSGGDSGGCGDSSGDCSGGGGDCSGDSGGDCSGGGGDDCNAGGRRGHGILWACLPLPFAVIARRRADRRRAKREMAS